MQIVATVLVSLIILTVNSLLTSSASLTSTNCPHGCSICPPPTYSQCQQCLIGYVLTPSNLCVPCPKGCLSCVGPQICSTCMAGYTKVTGGGLSQCLACPAHCSKCQFLQLSTGSVTLLTTCTNCYPGFYSFSLPNSTIQNCAPCITGCYSCYSNTSCHQCVAGFGYNQNSNQCYTCMENCITCSPAVGCQMCGVGYFLNVGSGGGGNTCAPCFQNCLQCTSDNTCTACIPGYYPITPSASISQQCIPCPNNCLSCHSQQICQLCSPSYYLNITEEVIYNNSTEQNTTMIGQASCEPCPGNCTTCVQGDICQVCQIGFFVDGSSGGLCQHCGIACQECLGAGMCLACLGSYYLAGGVCRPCVEPCSQCQPSALDQQGNIYCTECVSLYYTPISGQCLSCSSLSPGCLTCTSSSTCLTCQDGYNLYGGQCEQKRTLGAVYIVMICIAGIIGLVAIVFGVWACWRHRNGFGVGGVEDGYEGTPGVRASYYQIP